MAMVESGSAAVVEREVAEVRVGLDNTAGGVVCAMMVESEHEKVFVVEAMDVGMVVVCKPLVV